MRSRRTKTPTFTPPIAPEQTGQFLSLQYLRAAAGVLAMTAGAGIACYAAGGLAESFYPAQEYAFHLGVAGAISAHGVALFSSNNPKTVNLLLLGSSLMNTALNSGALYNALQADDTNKAILFGIGTACSLLASGMLVYACLSKSESTTPTRA